MREPSQRTSRLLEWAAQFAFVAIAAAAGWVLSGPGPLPDVDYWNMFGPFLSEGRLDVSWENLYRRSNEHIVAVANAFYVLNYLLFAGDNRGLVALTWVFAFVVGWVLLGVFVRGVDSGWGRMPAGLFVALAVFNPMTAHNFFKGMSGVAWFGANVFTVLAMAAGLRFQEGRGLRWLVVAAGCALVASQTYSTGVLALLALGVQLSLTARTRKAGAAVVAVGLAVLVAVALTQSTPAEHPHKVFNPIATAAFALAVVGGLFSPTPAGAIAIGAIGLLAFAIAAGRLLRSGAHRPVASLWIGLGTYVLFNAGLAGISRSGFGLEMSLASRYANLPALFWVSVVGLWTLWAPQPRSALAAVLRPQVFVSATLLPLALTAVAFGAPRVRVHQSLAEAKRYAALALYLKVYDESAIGHVSGVGVLPDGESLPHRLFQRLPSLESARHIPFNGYFDRCPKIGDRLDMALLRGTAAARGSIDRVQPAGPGEAVAVLGWAAAADHRPLVGPPRDGGAQGCLALLNQDGVVRGLALGGMSRGDVREALKTNTDGYGWSGFALPLPGDTELWAVAPSDAPSGWTAVQPGSWPLLAAAQEEDSSGDGSERDGDDEHRAMRQQ